MPQLIRERYGLGLGLGLARDDARHELRGAGYRVHRHCRRRADLQRPGRFRWSWPRPRCSSAIVFTGQLQACRVCGARAVPARAACSFRRRSPRIRPWRRSSKTGLFGSQPLGDRDYLLLVAGNIGAVIMPWMIFYQQSATVDKGLQDREICRSRASIPPSARSLTQLIMIAIVVTAAATLFVHGQQVEDAAHAALALVPLTGSRIAGVAFGAGLLGAAMLGALVVSLASAWAFGEAFAWPCSLNYNCTQAKRFYGLYGAMVVIAAGIVLVPTSPAGQDHGLRRSLQRARPADRARAFCSCFPTTRKCWAGG